MSNLGDYANRAGEQAQAQGHGLQRNSRFVDPWKKAAGQIAEARLRGADFGGPRRAHQAPPRIGRVQGFLLTQIAKGARLGAGHRETARWHTPQEYTPQGVENQIEARRSQQQPGDRAPEQSAEGNLSEEQFIDQHRAQFGFDPPPLA